MRCEAFAHQRDRLIGVPAPHRQDGANIAHRATGTTDRRVEAPMWPHRAGVSAWPLSPVARATCAIPLSAVPMPHGIASVRNPSTLRANRSRAASHVADGVFDVPEQMLGLRDHLHVAGAVGERDARACSSGACALEFSLRVPHHTPLRGALSTQQPAEETAGSESVHTTGGLRPHAPGSPRRTTDSTRCRTLRRDGRAR